MKRSIAIALTMTILIGVLALAFNNAFGYETIMFLQKEQINAGTSHFYIWKFDFFKYINNLQLTTSNLSVLQFDLPTRTWGAINTISDFGNNMLVILDYIILIINILLYPLKVGSYLLQNMLAILGINTDTTATNNGLAWLVTFVRDILGNIAIPYL